MLHSEAELRAAIERATADLDGIVAVFQALLRIAEIEAGSRRAAFRTFDFAPVLAGVVELYDAVAEDRGLSVSLDMPPHLPLHGDRELLQQAVANLLDNAVKFSPAGQTVQVLARAAPAGVDIVVTDHGAGHPAGRSRAGHRTLLPRRDGAQHAGRRDGARAGAGGGEPARRCHHARRRRTRRARHAARSRRRNAWLIGNAGQPRGRLTALSSKPHPKVSPTAAD